MKFASVLLASMVVSAAHGQKVVDVTNSNGNMDANTYNVVNGNPFVNVKYVNVVEGSPFLQKYWMKGVVIGKNGQKYSGSPVKLDLLKQDVWFLRNGVELISSIPAKEVILTDTITGEKYRFILSDVAVDTKSRTGWLQVLDSGAVSLYKYYNKTISETLPYGDAVYEQRIRTADNYFLKHNAALIPVKKLNDVLIILSDKKKELKEYMEKQDDKSNSTEYRFTNLIKYYNSLAQK